MLGGLLGVEVNLKQMTNEQIRDNLIEKHLKEMRKDYADENGIFCDEFRNVFVKGDAETAIRAIKYLYDKTI